MTKDDVSIIGKLVKDMYGTTIGNVLGTLTHIDGKIQTVGIGLWLRRTQTNSIRAARVTRRCCDLYSGMENRRTKDFEKKRGLHFPVLRH